MNPLSLIFGGVVGLSLGMTGGGGAIFAVPLLVYGLQLSPRDAVFTSTFAVALTSLVGFIKSKLEQQVDIKVGTLFAVAGMIGAPLGSWLANRLSDGLLLFLFALLMLVVASRMWLQSFESATKDRCNTKDDTADQVCSRDAAGRLVLTSRCALTLLFLGVLTGVLTGLFGVGGGFVIVPALVLFGGMEIHTAVGTSLMVISLVSGTGFLSQWLLGRATSTVTALPFVVGGISGMFVGQFVGKRLPAPVLQRIFSIAILFVALFVLFKHFSHASI